MAKPKKDRGKVIGMDLVKGKCIECNSEYEATRTTYENGEVVISPMRCKPCQTAHLTNLRVNKTIKDIDLLGNLKTRLNKEQREAITDAVGEAFNGLLDRYSGSNIKALAFDLNKVKA